MSAKTSADDSSLQPLLAAMPKDLLKGRNVLITGAVPKTASPGQSASYQLLATSKTQGQRASSTDTVVVASGPVLSVTKSASP